MLKNDKKPDGLFIVFFMQGCLLPYLYTETAIEAETSILL